MKTLYLHIGTTKTATSSIQKFLKINRTVLEQHNYCYPPLLHTYSRISTNRNGHFLVGNLYQKDGSRDTLRERIYRKDGMKQVLNCFKQYDNVILSDEVIWRVTSRSRKNLFPYLKKRAQEHGFSVKIIVYLRRQDDFQISLWNQNVKHSRTAMTLTFDERLAQVLEEESYVLNYADKLDEIAAIFGKENIIVRRFEPESWVNGSIIDDFMQCIGLPITNDFKSLKKQVNSGLSGNAAEIKRIINKDSTLTQGENIYLGSFLKKLSPASEKRYPSRMLSADETRDLLHRFDAENERVAKEYVGDGKPLFTDEIKKLPKWEPDNPYMTEDIIHFFTAVCIDLHRENEKLNSALKKQQEDLFCLKHPFSTIWNRIFHRKKLSNKGTDNV